MTPAKDLIKTLKVGDRVRFEDGMIGEVRLKGKKKWIWVFWKPLVPDGWADLAMNWPCEKIEATKVYKVYALAKGIEIGKAIHTRNCCIPTSEIMIAKAVEHGRELERKRIKEIIMRLPPCGYAQVEACHENCYDKHKKGLPCEHGQCMDFSKIFSEKEEKVKR